jgi:hypothetical protein
MILAAINRSVRRKAGSSAILATYMEWPRNDTGPPRWEDAELASWAVRISYLTHTVRIISCFLKVRCSYLPTNTEGGRSPLSAVRKRWRLCPVIGTRGRAITRWQGGAGDMQPAKTAFGKTSHSPLSVHDRKLLMNNEEGGKWRDLEPTAQTKSSMQKKSRTVYVNNRRKPCIMHIINN